MSSWIHANGVIMLSTSVLWCLDEKTKEKDLEHIRKNILGKVIEFGEEPYIGTHMPYGSEGSLDYTITECAGYINIIICGNLRDLYEEDLDSIENWYKNIIQQLNDIKGMYVREHMFEVYVEYGEKRIMSDVYSEDYDERKNVSVIKIPYKKLEHEEDNYGKKRL